MAIDLSAFDKTKLTDVKPKVAEGFKIQDTTENLVMPPAKPIGLFSAETFSQLPSVFQGVGQTIKKTLYNLPTPQETIKGLTQPTGYLGKETLKQFPTALKETVAGIGEKMRTTAFKFAKAELEVGKGAAYITGLQIPVLREKIIQSHPDEVIKYADAYESLVGPYIRKTYPTAIPLAIAEKLVGRKLAATYDEMSKKNPIETTVSGLFGDIYNLALIHVFTGGISDMIKIPQLITVNIPYIANFIPNAIENAVTWGTKGLIDEGLKQFETGKLDSQRLVTEPAKNALFGVLLAGAGGIQETIPRILAYGGVGAGWSTVEGYLKDKKIDRNDFLNITATTILSMAFAMIDADATTRQLEETGTNAYLEREAIIKVQSNHPGMSENDAKAIVDLISKLGGLEKVTPAIFQEVPEEFYYIKNLPIEEQKAIADQITQSIKESIGKGTPNFDAVANAIQQVKIPEAFLGGRVKKPERELTTEELIQQKGGWKTPQLRQQFDKAISTKDAVTIKRLLPNVPKAYKQSFATKINTILKEEVIKPAEETITKVIPFEATVYRGMVPGVEDATLGQYYSTDKETASFYAGYKAEKTGKEGKITEEKISIKNPLYVEGETPQEMFRSMTVDIPSIDNVLKKMEDSARGRNLKAFDDAVVEGEQLIKDYAQQKGYGGVVFNKGETIIKLPAEQIKAEVPTKVPENWKQVVPLRDQGLTLEQVGKKLGYSVEKVRQIEVRMRKEAKPEVTKPTITPKAEEAKLKEVYQAEYERVQKVEEDKLLSDIRNLGGLKTDPTLKEEMSDLPINIMRKDGVSPDEMLDMLDARGYDFKSVSDMFDSIRAISSMPTRYKPAESILDQKLTTIQTIRTKMPKIKEVTATQLERLERQLLREAKVGRNIPPKQVIAKAVGLKPEPEKMITKKESTLLKMKLRAEAKGATEGMRQARADIISQLRITRTDTTDIRRQITDYVKQALDPADRGKANVLIRDAKNQEDLVKAFSRIDTWAENSEKKAIRNDVVSSVRKAIESPAVAIDYKAKIKEVIDEFELKGHLGRTLQKLEATKKYIDERLSAGEDIEIPQRIWNALKILTRKPYEEITVSELRGLQDEVKILDAVGRMKWATYKDIYKLEQTATKDALIEGTTPMERREKITPKIGERLSISQRFKNNFIDMTNAAKKVDKVILPMDALFDWLDGAKGTFSGSNTRLIKAKIDRGWNLYQTLKDDIQDPVVERAIQLKMKDMNMERIGFVAAREQEGGMDKLKQLGYTEEEVNDVKLTKEEQEMLDMMRSTMEKEYPYVVDIMRKVYNQPVGKVKNYFSFMTDWSKTDETEIYKRMGPGAEEFGLPTKTVEQGFTIPRRAMAKQKIKLNAMSIFLRHTDNTSYLRSLGRDIKMLFEIVNSDEYRKASGDLGQLLVLEWLDLMARKGGSVGSKKIALIDTMRKNLGAGMIGFKLSSAAVQWTEVIPSMGLIGPEYGMKGIFNISVSKDWREFVMKFPEIRNRSGGETAIQELTQGSAFRKLQAKAFLPLEKIDTWGAMSVAAGAYEKKMAELGKEIDLSKEPNQEAMEYAQQIVRRNQGVAGYKDTPLAVSRGALTGSTSIDRAFLQFQNFVLFRWSRIRYEALKAGIDAKDPLKVAGILFWTIMGMIAAVGTKMGVDLLSDFVTGKDTKDVVQAKKFIYEAIGTVPFLGNLYGSYLYDNELIPIFSAPTQALQDLKKAITSKKETTRAKGLAGFITTLMTLMGVPGMLQTEQLIQKAIPTESAGTKSTMPKMPTLPTPKMPPAPKMPAGPKLNLNNLIKNLLRKELT